MNDDKATRLAAARAQCDICQAIPFHAAIYKEMYGAVKTESIALEKLRETIRYGRAVICPGDPTVDITKVYKKPGVTVDQALAD